ncbi:MAG: prolipoprotein diacylglyceryl transferase [Phycisphaerae bacterium]|nr:prolipoprotein diacylglyceryl transferase [Phycisphaerae bacterium]
MHPILFEIPLIHVTIKTYGFLMVIGFLSAVVLMRRMMRRIGEDPEKITNTALYALIAGVVGSRIFYIFHHLDQFRGQWLDVFAVWKGGLEFLGGVIFAVVVMILYQLRQRLMVRRYFDVLAVGLMLGLGFGRIGCLMFGCCFGKPCELPWAIRFPYASPSFYSQVYPDANRGRLTAYWDLPKEYFGYLSDDGKKWFPVEKEENKYQCGLKPKQFLTDQQRIEVTQGLYLAQRIHPTQIYEALTAFFICLLMYGFWRWLGIRKPGITLGLVLILYGTTRFLLEFLRDDNPFEYNQGWLLYNGGTISQNICLYLILLGVILLMTFMFFKAVPVPQKHRRK